ncbi:MAG TPA: energy transducer TonB [Pyrinomonadaceae bacterium]|nr:energy transducer TonB [Pyrinomonadaceae bacterium]
MRKMTVRLIVALLAFGVGVCASALWTFFGAVQVPAPAMSTSVLVAPGGCGSRVFIEPPPPPMPPSLPGGKIITAGVLNGKAISKPHPAYPPIAKAARASGTVTVHIVVGENGNVITASAVGGHPLLQQAAVAAARHARFSPTLLSGQSVKVSGVITYNFILQ